MIYMEVHGKDLRCVEGHFGTFLFFFFFVFVLSFAEVGAYMQAHCTEHMNWQRQKTYFRTCTRSEDSDQPAHSHSLIKLLIGAFWIAKGVKFLQTNNDD